jgi:hypothetical protein
MRAAVDGGEHGAHRAHAAAADDVDFDAGLLKGAHRAGMIGAVGARAGKQQGGTALG